MKKMTGLVLILLLAGGAVSAQEGADALLDKIKAKYNSVKDYEASARMKTNVAFIKAPVANIKIFYKNPDKIRIKNESGISFIPKGSVNINMGNVFSLKKYTTLDAGTETWNGKPVRVIKVLPDDDDADIVLSTLYINETDQLVVKSKTTTKENGTYELEMTYGKFISYGLPDKIKFSFNTKDYKLPKGVTFDYDNGSSSKPADKLKDKKGTVEIVYSSYIVNKGLSDDIFK